MKEGGFATVNTGYRDLLPVDEIQNGDGHLRCTKLSLFKNKRMKNTLGGRRKAFETVELFLCEININGKNRLEGDGIIPSPSFLL